MAWEILAAGLLGAGANIYSAGEAADAAKEGGEAQIAYAKESRDMARADQAPYRQAGYTALNALMALTGLPGVRTPDPYDGYGGNAVERTQRAMQGLSIIPGATWQGKLVFTDGEGGLYASRGRGARGVDNLQYLGQATDRGVRPLGGNSRAFIRTDGGGVLSYRDGQFYAGRGPRARAIDVAAPEPIEDQFSGGAEGGGYPAGQPTPEEMLKADPGYQFRMDEGMRALERGAAARGGLLAGGFARKAIRYGQDYASNEYTNVYNRLANIAGLGQVSAGYSSNAAMQYGQMAGQAAGDAALTRGSAYIAAGNSFNNLLGSGMQALGYFNQPNNYTPPFNYSLASQGLQNFQTGQMLQGPPLPPGYRP